MEWLTTSTSCRKSCIFLSNIFSSYVLLDLVQYVQIYILYTIHYCVTGIFTNYMHSLQLYWFISNFTEFWLLIKFGKYWKIRQFSTVTIHCIIMELLNFAKYWRLLKNHAKYWKMGIFILKIRRAGWGHCTCNLPPALINFKLWNFYPAKQLTLHRRHCTGENLSHTSLKYLSVKVYSWVGQNFSPIGYSISMQNSSCSSNTENVVKGEYCRAGKTLMRFLIWQFGGLVKDRQIKNSLIIGDYMRAYGTIKIMKVY